MKGPAIMPVHSHPLAGLVQQPALLRAILHVVEVAMDGHITYLGSVCGVRIVTCDVVAPGEFWLIQPPAEIDIRRNAI
jgi:hypothetical protein